MSIESEINQLLKLDAPELPEADTLEKWLLFLKGNRQMKEALAMESPTMKEAFEEIQRLSEDPATRRIAEYRDAQLRGQQQREIDREKAGMAKRDREIVLNMHSQQIAAETIAKLTGIDLDDVLMVIVEN